MLAQEHVEQHATRVPMPFVVSDLSVVPLQERGSIFVAQVLINLTHCTKTAYSLS